MHIQTLTIDDQDAPLSVWLAQEDSGLTPIHFAHANGFPAGSYQRLLSELAQNRTVYALDHRATWDGSPYQASKHFSWKDGADDLIKAIEQFAPQGVIGVGHSLGAVITLLAADKRPDLFKQILLIEPVVFPARFFLAFAWLPQVARMKLFKIVQRTLQRREQWRSREEFVDTLSKKSLFKGISREVLNDYAQHGLREVTTDSHPYFTLRFRKTWEAKVFMTAPYLWSTLKRLSIPCVVWRAEQGDVVPLKSWQRWEKSHPHHSMHVLPSLGHMAPLQNPQLMAREIQNNFLSI
ncbi:alpha/beta fold hydrolase [Hydromonas duriensis]|uniref:Pimeloyl-ACP methyl ester carboxylesterase n=1 Tax=Hydromonas duriensis TaxID=1527608 RepID=A0A4R6YBJ3_9BURK|nr:alpha/beta hydrolase [Hydromonas duriensis]TDR33015.1 pimeloyl-ACP methyl ester carboxylesterase [Hydromonas duriensis]